MIYKISMLTVILAQWSNAAKPDTGRSSVRIFERYWQQVASVEKSSARRSKFHRRRLAGDICTSCGSSTSTGGIVSNVCDAIRESSKFSFLPIPIKMCGGGIDIKILCSYISHNGKNNATFDERIICSKCVDSHYEELKSKNPNLFHMSLEDERFDDPNVTDTMCSECWKVLQRQLSDPITSPDMYNTYEKENILHHGNTGAQDSNRTLEDVVPRCIEWEKEEKVDPDAQQECYLEMFRRMKCEYDDFMNPAWDSKTWETMQNGINGYAPWLQKLYKEYFPKMFADVQHITRNLISTDPENVRVGLPNWNQDHMERWEKILKKNNLLKTDDTLEKNALIPNLHSESLFENLWQQHSELKCRVGKVGLHGQAYYGQYFDNQSGDEMTEFCDTIHKYGYHTTLPSSNKRGTKDANPRYYRVVICMTLNTADGYDLFSNAKGRRFTISLIHDPKLKWTESELECGSFSDPTKPTYFKATETVFPVMFWEIPAYDVMNKNSMCKNSWNQPKYTRFHKEIINFPWHKMTGLTTKSLGDGEAVDTKTTSDKYIRTKFSRYIEIMKGKNSEELDFDQFKKDLAESFRMTAEKNKMNKDFSEHLHKGVYKGRAIRSAESGVEYWIQQQILTYEQNTKTPHWPNVGEKLKHELMGIPKQEYGNFWWKCNLDGQPAKIRLIQNKYPYNFVDRSGNNIVHYVYWNSMDGCNVENFRNTDQFKNKFDHIDDNDKIIFENGHKSIPDLWHCHIIVRGDHKVELDANAVEFQGFPEQAAKQK